MTLTTPIRFARMIHSPTWGRPRGRPFRVACVVKAALGIAAAASIAHADELLRFDREPPLYPSIITTVYQGKSCPIIAVSGELPQIMVDGKLTRLHSDQTYQIPRAVGFAAGRVQVEAQDAEATSTTHALRWGMSNNETTSSTVANAVNSENGTYKCTLLASEPHSDCYIAVVFYRNDSSGDPDPGSVSMAFRQVGDLLPGHETNVTITKSYIVAPGEKAFFFPLVYSKGLEIRTDYCEASARFFRRSEMIAHGLILARYREQYPSSDRPASAYLRFQPEFPAGFNMRTLPAVVTAKFAVTETGEVDSLELNQVLDSEANHDIRRAIEGWLFLPRLKNGYPVRTMIQVPLSFAPGTS